MISGGPMILDLDGAFLGPDRDALLRRHERYGAALATLVGSQCTTLNVLVPRSFRSSRGLGFGMPHVEISAGLPQFDPQFLVKPSRRLAPDSKQTVWVASDPFKTGPLQLLAAKRSGTRLQIQVHGDIGLARSGRTSLSESVRYTVARRVLQEADSIRAVSEMQAQALMERFGLDQTRVFVAPVPIDPVFLKGPIAQSVGPPRILFAGRLHPERGVDTWATVARAVAHWDPEAQFDIIGAGPSESDFRARLSGLSRVTWHGQLSPAKVAQIMSESTVLLSTPPAESYGRSLVEALCVGLPVVATDTSGSRRIAAHPGVSISQNPEELAELALTSSALPGSAEAVAEFRRKQESHDSESIRRLAASWI